MNGRGGEKRRTERGRERRRIKGESLEVKRQGEEGGEVAVVH